MPSRRSFLIGGAVILTGGTAAFARPHRIDDIGRAIGLHPVPQPSKHDAELLKRVRSDHLALYVAAGPDLRPALASQLVAVGGHPAGVQSHYGPPPDLVAAARQRQQDALAARSPELIRTLTSMAAGLAVMAEPA